MIVYPAIRRAYQFARDLDLLLAAGPDDVEHDALLNVGELLGGLSIHGFEEDLAATLDKEARVAEDSGYHCRLTDLTALANMWLALAKLIMTPAINYMRADPVVRPGAAHTTPDHQSND